MTTEARGYIFLHTTPPTPAYADAAADLLNAPLGEGFIMPAELELLTGEGGVLVRAIDPDGNMVGAATARVLSPAAVTDLASRLRREGVVDGPVARLAGECVGELKSAAVSPEVRGTGIGSAMVRERLDFLAAHGCTVVVCASWVTAGQSSRGILETAGFEHAATIPGYWADDQQDDGYLCAACGTSCVCSATFMIHPMEPRVR